MRAINSSPPSTIPPQTSKAHRMNSTNQLLPSRRQFIKGTGQVAAVSALATLAAPSVHAAVDETINIVLIGCGGRGTGTATDALNIKGRGPIKLVAMADVFKDRLDGSYNGLKKKFDKRVDVPAERQVLGLRRLQKGDGLPEAGRHRDLRHAAGLPLGAFHLRDRQGAERVHGKAGHGRWSDLAQNVQAGRAGQGEESQSGRRPDVAASAARCSNWPIEFTAARSAISFCYAAIGCMARSAKWSLRRPTRTCRTWNTRFAGSIASCGPAAAAIAISTSTSSIIAAG